MEPDVLLIVCDTARADAFSPWAGPHPTPAVERLAAQGIVYERAIAPAPWTLPSHGSLFTGLLPTEHRITGERLGWTEAGPSTPASAVRAFGGSWLPEELRARGYRTFGVSTNPWIGTWAGFDRGFDAFVDVRPRAGRRPSRLRRAVGRARQVISGRGHGGAAALDALRGWLRDVPRGPVFAFVNLMELHSPYDPPMELHPFLGRGPSGASWRGRPQLLYYQYGQMGRFRTRTDPRYVSAMRALYFASAGREDALVGAMVGSFRRRGRRAVVVLVSDHGENLGDHGLWGHHSSLHETLLHVPLVLWGDGLGQGRVVRPTSTARLARWIVGVAEGRGGALEPGDGPVVAEYESAVRQFGAALPPELRRSLPADVPSLVTEPGVAVRVGREKFVATWSGAEFLYDLASDPAERQDVLGRHAGAAERFRPFVGAWRRRREVAAGEIEAGGAVGEEIAAHLRDLGYIE